MRGLVSSAINIFHMKEMRIPRLSTDDPLLKKMADFSARLVCGTKEFEQIRTELKIEKLNEGDRMDIISRLDALSAKICNLTKEELEYVLTTFPSIDKELKQKIISNFNKETYQKSN